MLGDICQIATNTNIFLTEHVSPCLARRIKKYIYIHIHTHTHTYIHIHTHTYIHTYIHTHIYTYIHTHTHTYTYTHIYIHIYTHIHTHIHTHTYIHIYIHTHTGVEKSMMNIKYQVWSCTQINPRFGTNTLHNPHGHSLHIHCLTSFLKTYCVPLFKLFR